MDTEVNQVSEVHEKEIILVNGEELDNKDILAKLCIDAESISTDIRDCLRAYDLELTTRQLKVAFHAFQKNVIVDTLNFLKAGKRQWSNYLKDACVHELICRIQNLLIDKCQFCLQNYATDKDEKLLLSCSICGQSVHDSCLQNILGNKYTNELTACDVLSLLNPYNLSSFHFLCNRCSVANIPQSVNGLKKSALAKMDGPNTNSLSGSNSVAKGSDSPESNDESLLPPSVDSSAGAMLPEANKKAGFVNRDTQKSDKVCRYYLKGTCKHGRKGASCLFAHPPYCNRLLTYGTHSSRGCNKGSECEFVHPKMCYKSLSKRQCFNENCPFFHIKGTKRKIDQNNHNHNQHTPYNGSHNSHPPSNKNEVVDDHSIINTGSSDFLCAINVLRQDLLQALESRINSLVRLQQNPECNMNPYQAAPQNLQVANQIPSYQNQNLTTQSLNYPVMQMHHQSPA